MKLLCVDVGRGTQDILLCDPGAEMENALQMVLPSRTVLLAGEIERATARGERVVLHGVTMGGGPLARAARRHIAAGHELLATPPAAVSFSDDPAAVRAMGVRLIDPAEVAGEAARTGARLLETADVHLPSLRRSLEAWGIDPSFTAAAVAIQDHGAAPPGESDRVYRFAWFRAQLAREPNLVRQYHLRAGLPPRFTRMAGVAASLPEVEKLVLMDTGFAALLGACLDPRVGTSGTRILVNAGNGHLLAAVAEGLALRALFEHHTARLGAESFARDLRKLAEGRLEDEEVFADGGHGAWRAESYSPATVGTAVRSITGPRRGAFAAVPPGYDLAAPFGSMMVAGCFGLLAALFHACPELGGAELPEFRPLLEARHAA